MSKEREKLFKIIEALDPEGIIPIEFTTQEYDQLKKELNTTGAKLGVHVILPKNKGSKK